MTTFSTPPIFNGEATLVFTDVNTGKQRTVNKTNTVKYNKLLTFAQSLLSANHSSSNVAIPYNIQISDVPSPNSKHNWVPPSVGSRARINGFVDPSQVSPKYFAEDGPTPAYIQIIRRFSPPTTDRTVSLIALTDIPASYPYDMYSTDTYTTSRYSIAASITLDPPCIQTTSEILDIYYRIVFPSNTASALTNVGRDVYNYLSVFSSYPSGSTLVSIGDGHMIFDQFPTSTAFNSKFNNLFGIACWISLNTGSDGSMYPSFRDNSPASVNVRDLAASRTINWDLNTHVGAILTTARSGLFDSDYGQQRMIVTTLSHDILKPGSSTIQPVHGHSSTGTRPFLDTSALASGSGRVIPISTTAQSSFPEMYRINITASGNVGTATYKFDVRHHNGFVGNTYINRGIPIPHVHGQGQYTQSADVINQSSSIVGGHGLLPTTLSEYTLYTNDLNWKSHAKRYSDDVMMLADTNGVTKVKISDHTYVANFDSTTTPQLSVTNIRQINRDAVGNIWVACADTGLWKISADDSTVQRMTIAGVTDTNCHAVDASNTHVWAVMNGGLVSSTDGGTNWTIYHSTTPTVFSWAGITDNNWADVAFIKVNPTHVDQRIMLVRKSTAAGVSSNAAVWWSTTTLASSAHSAAFNVATVNPYIKGKDYLIQTAGDYWVAYSVNSANIGGQTTTTTLRLLTFGTANAVSVVGPNGQHSTSPIDNGFAPDKVTGELKPIFINREVNFGLIELDGTVSNPMAFSGYMWNGSNPTGRSPVPSQERPMIYMGNGLIVRPVRSYDYATNSINYVTYTWLAGFIGTSTGLTESYYDYLLWKSYGWNGSTWLQGHPGSKTVHVTSEQLINNISIRFEDGAGTSFTSTDYYTFGRMVGVWKDNVTTLSWSPAVYAVPMISGIHNVGTVTQRAGRTTTPVLISRSGIVKHPITGLYSHSYMADPNMAPYRAISEGYLNGDFEISMVVTAGDFSTVHQVEYHTTVARMLTSYNVSEVPLGFRISNTGGLFYIASGITYNYETSSAAGATTGVTLVVGDTVAIRCAAGVFTLRVNGTAVYTRPDTIVSERSYMQSLYTYTYNPALFTQALEVVYNGPEYSSDIGSAGLNTGIFDSKFLSICATPSSLVYGTLDSNPTTITLVNVPSPAAGTMHISPTAGKVYFNSADVGKVYDLTTAYIRDY